MTWKNLRVLKLWPSVLLCFHVYCIHWRIGNWFVLCNSTPWASAICRVHELCWIPKTWTGGAAVSLVFSTIGTRFISFGISSPPGKSVRAHLLSGSFVTTTDEGSIFQSCIFGNHVPFRQTVSCCIFGIPAPFRLTISCCIFWYSRPISSHRLVLHFWYSRPISSHRLVLHFWYSRPISSHRLVLHFWYSRPISSHRLVLHFWYSRPISSHRLVLHFWYSRPISSHRLVLHFWYSRPISSHRLVLHFWYSRPITSHRIVRDSAGLTGQYSFKIYMLANRGVRQ